MTAGNNIENLTPQDNQPGPDEHYIHSDIWERLIGSASDDLIGIVAYGLYQKEKREWIDYIASTKGCKPSRDEVQQFSYSYRDSALTKLLSQAEGRLSAFGDEITQAALEELQNAAFNQRVSREIATARDELRNIKDTVIDRTGMKHHIIGHIAGFTAVVVIGLAVTFLISNEKSPREIIDHVKGRVEPHAASRPSTDVKQDAPDPPPLPSNIAPRSKPGGDPHAKPSRENTQ